MLSPSPNHGSLRLPNDDDDDDDDDVSCNAVEGRPVASSD